jgi:hypothetical protein
MNVTDSIRHRWNRQGKCIFCAAQADRAHSPFCEYLNLPMVRAGLPIKVQATWIAGPGGVELQTEFQWVARIIRLPNKAWQWLLHNRNNRNITHYATSYQAALAEIWKYLNEDPVERYEVQNAGAEIILLDRLQINMNTVPGVVIDATKEAAMSLQSKVRQARDTLKVANAEQAKAQDVFNNKVQELRELAAFLDAQPDCKPPGVFSSWKIMLVDPLYAGTF